MDAFNECFPDLTCHNAIGSVSGNGNDVYQLVHDDENIIDVCPQNPDILQKSYFGGCKKRMVF